MFAFVQVYPIDHRFDKIVSITDDENLVNKVFELIESNETFKRSFDRLDSSVIHSITENEMDIVKQINDLIGSNIDWVDELIIQEVTYAPTAW